MIKFLDLKQINHRFELEFQQKFKTFLDSGSYILGEEVESFENEYAQYCCTKYCIGVSNGLDAIKLILKAYEALGRLNQGDDIIVPANTYIATVLAVSDSGFNPILVEPDNATFNIDPDEILKYITPKTKAILGVHLYGQLYDVEKLEAICKARNLLLIEDAAQAHGAVYSDGRKAGNVSNAAAFSFYPTKNLGALGDAGAITTNDEELNNIIMRLRNYGRVSSYENDIKGYNCRLDELQAAFLRVKLKHLDYDNQKRREIANYYLKNIKNDLVSLPHCKDLSQHVFHLFVIRTKNRDKLKEYLLNKGVEAAIHYPIPIHQQKAYGEYNNLKFPITESFHGEVLSLPINPLLVINDVDRIVKNINLF